MIWLGPQRGYLSDWITQRWVQCTGRRIDLGPYEWLAGPTAPPTGIGSGYFEDLARKESLRLDRPDGPEGIVPDFRSLRGETFKPEAVHPEVARFYEETSAYELDAWAEWCGLFRPFGCLLAVCFSRRLQQLNVPLSGLDTSRGLTNEILRFVEPETESLRHTAWFRRLQGSGNVLYAGFYSLCRLPGRADPCIKVVFPLPEPVRTERRDPNRLPSRILYRHISLLFLDPRGHRYPAADKAKDAIPRITGQHAHEESLCRHLQ